MAERGYMILTEDRERYANHLGVAYFVKRISLVALNTDAGARPATSAAALSRGEELTARGAAVRRLTTEG